MHSDIHYLESAEAHYRRNAGALLWSEGFGMCGSAGCKFRNAIYPGATLSQPAVMPPF